MAQSKILLEALDGRVTERIPFWFMRQAGRYLPEYREVRASTKGFLDLCFTPEKAAEVTLQPIRRFGMDGAILFSDILVIPHALGVEVKFAEGEGPIVEQTLTEERIAALKLKPEALLPIYETIRLVKKELPDHVAFLGFAGAPWTVACYMLQGKSGKDFLQARKFAYAHPERMQQLIDALIEATIHYLRAQIDAGVEAIQLFDSWAGLLTPPQFRQWSIEPNKKIVAAIRQSHPHIPVIGFAKGAMLNLKAYAKETGVHCIGIDQQTDLAYGISCRANDQQAVQGNLDPLLLAADKNAMLGQAAEIIKTFGRTPCIFNLGHGFEPHTPVAHVEALVDYLKSVRR